jgi:hypothetical protein
LLLSQKISCKSGGAIYGFRGRIDARSVTTSPRGPSKSVVLNLEHYE